jgi:hypothetical protein
MVGGVNTVMGISVPYSQELQLSGLKDGFPSTMILKISSYIKTTESCLRMVETWLHTFSFIPYFPVRHLDIYQPAPNAFRWERLSCCNHYSTRVNRPARQTWREWERKICKNTQGGAWQLEGTSINTLYPQKIPSYIYICVCVCVCKGYFKGVEHFSFSHWPPLI